MSTPAAPGDSPSRPPATGGAPRGGRRSVLVASVALAITALAAGCGSSTTSSPSTSSTTGSSSETAATAASYEAAPCPDPNVPGIPSPADFGPEFTCGYLTVPEDRSNPTGPTIRLAVARVPAVSDTPAPDPIVYVAGGPGTSALVTANSVVDTGMNADRDVIFLDQRGIMHSEPNIACPEFDTYFAASMLEHFSSPETGAKSNAATQACHDRLVAEGVDLAAFDTTANAQDVADLRVAMGIDEWNLFGVSYGTDVTLTVLRDHPQGIRSVVLDSVVPPNRNLVPGFWPGAAEGLEAMIGACADQPACAAAYPDLMGDFNHAVNALTEAPVTVAVVDRTGATVDVVIDGYQFANATVLLSAHGGLYEDGPAMIHAMANGDGTAVAELMLSFIGGPPGLYGWGLQWSAFAASSPLSRARRRSWPRARRPCPRSPPRRSRSFQLGRFFDDCKIWDVGESARLGSGAGGERRPRAADGRHVRRGHADLLAGRSHAGADQLAGGRLPRPGPRRLHAATCAITVMNAFLAHPDQPVDQTCAEQIALPVFTTP